MPKTGGATKKGGQCSSAHLCNDGAFVSFHQMAWVRIAVATVVVFSRSLKCKDAKTSLASCLPNEGVWPKH